MSKTHDEPLQDMDATCKDCQQSFVFTVAEQEFFFERKWPVPRQRCRPCTTAKKAKRGEIEPLPAAPSPASGSSAAAPREKLTLWINQVPFEANAEDIARHFGVHSSSVRLVMKDGGKHFSGTAFVDVPDFNSLDRGIALHQSKLTCSSSSSGASASRRINVRQAETKETLAKIKESSIAKRGAVLAKAYGSKKKKAKTEAAPPMAAEAQPQEKEKDERSRPAFKPAAGTRCFACGEEGHMSFDCPKPRSKEGGKGGGRACYSCGEPGHRSIDCPKRFPSLAGHGS